MIPALEHDLSAYPRYAGELLALAQRANDAGRRYRVLGMVNVPQKPEDRIALDIAYERARREWEAADLAYRNGIQAAANEPITDTPA